MLAAMTSHPFRCVAVIGSGMSGATCAQALTLAGHTVQVFDKARGPGGRLATRRMAWDDAGGRAWTTRLDHGALGITARSRAFRAFVDMGVQAGWLTGWEPMLAPTMGPESRSLGLLGSLGPIHLPVPDLPTVCRQLLDGTPLSASSAVEALHRSADGWLLQVGGERLPTLYDAVVLAIPPAQAAPLLAPHRADWSREAAQVTMQPCWTLMAIEAVDVDDVGDEPAESGLSARPWDLHLPADGPLAWVMRQDARPGRPRVAGQAHWVAHARIDWSLANLEQPPEWVRAQLLDALQAAIARPGQATRWHHAAVHRWRYALPPEPSAGGAPSLACWWDADQGLGVCGDFLGVGGLASTGDALGSAGVEAAWLSGRALARQLLSHDRTSSCALAEATT